MKDESNLNNDTPTMCQNVTFFTFKQRSSKDAIKVFLINKQVPLSYGAPLRRRLVKTQHTCEKAIVSCGAIEMCYPE